MKGVVEAEGMLLPYTKILVLLKTIDGAKKWYEYQQDPPVNFGIRIDRHSVGITVFFRWWSRILGRVIYNK